MSRERWLLALHVDVPPVGASKAEGPWAAGVMKFTRRVEMAERFSSAFVAVYSHRPMSNSIQDRTWTLVDDEEGDVRSMVVNYVESQRLPE